MMSKQTISHKDYAKADVTAVCVRDHTWSTSDRPKGSEYICPVCGRKWSDIVRQA